MHDMTQNHVQTPSAHCFGPKGFTKWKILKKFDAKGWTKRSEVYVYSNNHTKWSLKPCLQCMKWLNIMIRPPQPIVLVPKISPSEKFEKKFDARGWTKRAEVYFYSLCSEHTTKWSLCFKFFKNFFTWWNLWDQNNELRGSDHDFQSYHALQGQVFEAQTSFGGCSLHAVPFIRNIVKMCLVEILCFWAFFVQSLLIFKEAFWIVVSYFF